VHDRAGVVDVELVDHVRLAAVHVQRPLVHGHVRRPAVHGAQQPAGVGFDDRHRLAATPADVDGRPPPAGPVPAVRSPAQGALGHQLLQASLGDRAAEVGKVLRTQRELRRGAAQLGAEHVGVGRVGHRRLDRPAEQGRRVVGEVVVQRVVPGDEHHQRLPLCPTRPAGLLPQRGQRPRVPGEHDGVEPGDVDAELERVRGGHTPERAGRQGAFELAALLRQIAAAVGVDLRRQVRAAALAQQSPGLLGDGLGAATRADEGQRPGTLLDEVGQQSRGVCGGRPAQRRAVLPGAFGQGRFPQCEGRPWSG
jgi:hypothetical protein